jgi:predicted RNase H-like HicB family nuclease
MSESNRSTNRAAADRVEASETPKYEIVLYWSQVDGAFIAEVPELAGCMADGRTYQEAVANAEVVIREWVETARALGRPIPSPRGRLMYA